MVSRVVNASLRKVAVRCSNCDHCRDLMADTSCSFFAELYWLTDREKETGEMASPEEEKQLLSRCNLCGICPCPPIRAWIRDAKSSVVEQDGLSPQIRLLQDVRLVGQLASMAPKVINFVAKSEYLSRIVKGIAGIHPERVLPKVPDHTFDQWSKKRGIDRQTESDGRKVAYFVGCSARYLFPDVAVAAVEVMQRNGVTVYVPPQKCCGTPSMLEGDKRFTVDSMAFNVEQLSACVEQGYDIVCSCPSCGYLLKSVLREGAEYSHEFRARMDAVALEERGDRDRICKRLEEERLISDSSKFANANLRRWQLTFVQGGLFRDEGYFSSINALQRLKIANHTYDLGEYLLALDSEGALERPLGRMEKRMGYYAPCHLREQNIGSPWAALMEFIPGSVVEHAGDPFDCCGLAGIHGFKKAIHDSSIATANRLMEKLERLAPDQLVTDCLSCRVQFNQLRPYGVSHPVELLWQSMNLQEKGGE